MKRISEDGHERIRVETWGEVATHLGVEVRTAQRWESKLGLPVRRMQGSQAVYAYVDEIDAWRVSRETLNVDAQTTPAPIAPDLIEPAKRFVRSWMIGAAAAVVLLVVGAEMRYPRTSLEPATLSLQGSAIVALDDRGATLWSYQLDRTPTALNFSHRLPLGRWWHRLDTDSDGIDELIAIVGYRSPDSVDRERLYSFTLSGELRFQFEPDLSLTYNSRAFAPPWIFMDVEPVAFDHSLWLALANAPWWAGAVVSLDRTGHATLRYTQPGNVRVLTALTLGSEARVVASGVNNEYASASVALLDPGQPASRAPSAESGPYECQNCPTAMPLKYLLLPPSPLNKADAEPYNRVDSVFMKDRLFVQTYEAGIGAGIVYEVSPDLRVASATPTDTYWTWQPAAANPAAWSAQLHKSQAVVTRLWSDGVWSLSTLHLSPTHTPTG